MFLIRQLAVVLVVAVASANYKVEAAGDLSTICQHFDDTNSNGEADIQNDVEKFSKFAQLKLSNLAGVNNAEVNHLRYAWKRASNRKGCYPDALKDAALIAQCNPGQFKSLNSLTQAARSLVNECLSPEYISGKIEATIEDSACFLASCLREINAGKLIDDSFVEDYRKDNKDEKWMDLAAVKSEKAIRPLGNSITRLLARANKTPRDVFFHIDAHRIGRYLEKHLYKPCSSLVGKAASVMGQISQASLFIDAGLTGLLSHLNEATQEVVFRYSLCKTFIDEHRPEKLANELMFYFLDNPILEALMSSYS